MKVKILTFFLIAVILSAFTRGLYPVFRSMIDPGHMTIEYKWAGQDYMTIKAGTWSMIPSGYSLYLYNVTMVNRATGSYRLTKGDWTKTVFLYPSKTATPDGVLPPAPGTWSYVREASGLAEIPYLTDHLELVRAVCVKIGSDPAKALAAAGDEPYFDTGVAKNKTVKIGCK